MKYLVLILTLLAPLVANAAPTLKLRPVYEPAERIVLTVMDVSPSSHIYWRIIPKNKTKCDSLAVTAGLCFVWATPGSYDVIAIVGEPKDGGISWYDLTGEFAVAGSVTPQPAPEPTPPAPAPAPTPVVNAEIVDFVVKLCQPVTDDDKKGALWIIATAYKDNGKQYANFKTPEDLADATATEFVASLGIKRYLKWRPVMTRLKDHMTQLVKDGKLSATNMEEWGKLWEAYALGFSQAALLEPQPKTPTGGAPNAVR